MNGRFNGLKTITPVGGLKAILDMMMISFAYKVTIAGSGLKIRVSQRLNHNRRFLPHRWLALSKKSHLKCTYMPKGVTIYGTIMA